MSDELELQGHDDNLGYRRLKCICTVTKMPTLKKGEKHDIDKKRAYKRNPYYMTMTARGNSDAWIKSNIYTNDLTKFR